MMARKLFSGTTGNLNGLDVLRTIVAQPQAARFITAKLWKFFGSEIRRSDDLVEALASNFRRNGNNFKPFLRDDVSRGGVLFRTSVIARR